MQPAQDADLVELFLVPLEQHGIDYMISGSLASTQYGEPRVTLDVDLVLIIGGQPDRVAKALVAAFPEAQYYLPPKEVLRIEMKRANRGHFNVIHMGSGLKADGYPSSDHPRFEWAVANRRRIDVGGTACWFAPPEYVILHKLQFYKEGKSDKHIMDIQGMFEVSGESIDHAFLKQACGELGLTKEWELASARDTG